MGQGVKYSAKLCDVSFEQPTKVKKIEYWQYDDIMQFIKLRPGWNSLEQFPRSLGRIQSCHYAWQGPTH